MKRVFLFLILLACLPVFSFAPFFVTTYYVDSAITDTNPASATPDFTTYNPITFATTGGSASVYKTIADINAGVDVGLTMDYSGRPVPYGAAPEMGAYEFIIKRLLTLSVREKQ